MTIPCEVSYRARCCVCGQLGPKVVRPEMLNGTGDERAAQEASAEALEHRWEQTEQGLRCPDHRIGEMLQKILPAKNPGWSLFPNHASTFCGRVDEAHIEVGAAGEDSYGYTVHVSMHLGNAKSEAQALEMFVAWMRQRVQQASEAERDHVAGAVKQALDILQSVTAKKP